MESIGQETRGASSLTVIVPRSRGLFDRPPGISVRVKSRFARPIAGPPAPWLGAVDANIECMPTRRDVIEAEPAVLLDVRGDLGPEDAILNH
jgi:hypothetical protein